MAQATGGLFAPLTGPIGGALETLHASGLPLTIKQVKNARSMRSLRPRPAVAAAGTVSDTGARQRKEEAQEEKKRR